MTTYDRDAYEAARREQHDAATEMVGIVRHLHASHQIPDYARELVADILTRHEAAFAAQRAAIKLTKEPTP